MTTIMARFASIAVFGLLISTQAYAQVAFQPKNCDFRAVFVGAPDVKEVAANVDGQTLTSTIANLAVVLDGKPNFFRTECTEVDVPAQLDQKLLLEDMNTIAAGNNLRGATAWIEKGQAGDLIGRVRGQISDTKATYVIDIRRYFGNRNIFDVWVGSPPGTFPSEGNLIFLKELRLDGKPIFP